MPDTDQEAQEREERRRKALALLLGLLVATSADSLHRMAEDLRAGRLTVGQMGAAMVAMLADGHAHAAYVGRQWAGAVGPFGAADVQYGHIVAQGQAPFVAGLEDDLRAGRYAEDGAALDRRLDLYAKRLYGTAQEAWRLTLDGGELLSWVLDPLAQHCHDGQYGSCPDLAATSPRPASEWPCDPGDGSTECGANCRCSWLSAGGDTGPIEGKV